MRMPRTDTERKRQLFAWAHALLHQLGLTAKVAQAQSVDALRKITLDLNAVDVAPAIREALRIRAPGSGATIFSA